MNLLFTKARVWDPEKDGVSLLRAKRGILQPNRVLATKSFHFGRLVSLTEEIEIGSSFGASNKAGRPKLRMPTCRSIPGRTDYCGLAFKMPIWTIQPVKS